MIDILCLGRPPSPTEVLFFHRPSGTLILTDLAFNMVRFPRPFDRVFWRLSGIPAGFGPGRTTEQLLLRDRGAARRVLERALEWPIGRIVVAHGEAIDEAPKARLQAAFRATLGELSPGSRGAGPG